MRSKTGMLVMAALTTISASALDLKNGQAVYEKSCKACHGADGAGNPAVAKMLKTEIPALGSPEVQALSDDQVKDVITNGHGKMRPVKTVTGTALDDVVAYVRTLKK